jgi:hypothetical protein
LLQQPYHGGDIRLDLADRVGVVLGGGHFQQVAGIVDPAVKFLDRGDNALEGSALAAQVLGPVGVVPDAGFSQFQFYFGQSFLALVEVKDTP